MGEPQFSFKCAECRGGKLWLTGFELLTVDISFDAAFGSRDAVPTDWSVDYTMPKDGPRAFITCEKCRREVKVSCRNEATGRRVVLWPAEVYQLLSNAVALHGLCDGTFKGQVEVRWKEFLGKLISAHPQLGDGRRVSKGVNEAR